MTPDRGVRIDAEPWSRVRDHLGEGERQLDRCAGWLVGDTADVPCTVFLTDRSLILATRAWLLTNPARVVVSPFHTVSRCGTGTVERRRTRLVYVTDPLGTEDPETIEGFAIDLAGGRRGRRFGELVTRTFEQTQRPGTGPEPGGGKTIDWDEVRLRWAKKLQLLEQRPPLALPYASVSAMVVHGDAGGSDRQRIVEWLARTHPDELPLDMAPAKCRAVDEAFYEKARALGVLTRRVTQMEAQLLATDEAAYYIAPGIDDLHIRWPWTETTIRTDDRGTFATAFITTAGAHYEIALGPRAAANVAAIAGWASLDR